MDATLDTSIGTGFCVTTDRATWLSFGNPHDPRSGRRTGANLRFPRILRRRPYSPTIDTGRCR